MINTTGRITQEQRAKSGKKIWNGSRQSVNLNRRYIEKLERVVIWCSKEEKEEIKRAAEGAEVSMNEYLKGAAKERIARDTQGANG